MHALKVLMLEGLFYDNPETGLFSVQRDDGVIIPVAPELEKLAGRQIRLAAMHVPPKGLMPLEWGGGSCYWQGHGTCPAGHHEKPDQMLVFTCDGTLSETKNGWALSRFDGSVQSVPLDLMRGHYGRVIAATTDAVERMRDTLDKRDPEGQFDVLSGEAGRLRTMLERLRKVTGD